MFFYVTTPINKLVYFLLSTTPGTCSVNPKHTFFLTSLGAAGIWCYCVGCKKVVAHTVKNRVLRNTPGALRLPIY